MTSPEEPEAAPGRSAATIRPTHDADWPAVQRIYAEAIAAGNATFEAEAPDWERFNTARLPRHRFVAESVWRDTILTERRSPAI